MVGSGQSPGMMHILTGYGVLVQPMKRAAVPASMIMADIIFFTVKWVYFRSNIVFCNFHEVLLRKLNIRWTAARTGKISRRPRNIAIVYIILAKAGCEA